MGLNIKIPKNALKEGRKKYKEGGNYNNVELPKGTYIAAVTGGRGVETSNGPQIVLDLKVGGDCDPEYHGGSVSCWFSLEENRIIFLFKTLAKLGYDVDDLDEDTLEEILDELKENKPIVRLKAKKSGEYINLNIDKLLDDESYDELFAEGGEAAEEEEDDEEEDGDELDDLDRTGLKKFIKENELDVKVLKKMTDDDIRAKIREAVEDEEED